ncbi:proton-conducting transporter transmembrane domain-containing protein [Nonlabens antarcticus]|uniref:proton-conducting transporter transmembrane domain-containing protein n=1 Tax=Nonlabens antarcticus TaxID=392714 RepID=UPI001891EEFE|nr:proton-conducting transporter membrane subunit [Nonlabens antarcticus]
MALTQTANHHTQGSIVNHKEHQIPFISKIAAPLLWLFFFTSIALLTYYLIEKPFWNIQNIFSINSFTLLIWTTVTFFSAIVSTYSKSYLNGFTYQAKFTALCLGFTLSVMLFVMSSHIAPFLICWLAMGFFMAQLIGVDSKWGEAREASNFAQKFFLTGTICLGIGVILLAYTTQQYTILGIMDNLSMVSDYTLIVAALFIILAAIIQSAIYPFHRWLLSAMTSPTPASALMHAGFVNGAGILLALFASVMVSSNTLTLLFIIGGLTAIIAQFTKLLQVNVKQKLACSTIAQMGFMIMQCGLGFFNAAVAHLILHGFYKAYLFLSSGEEIAQGTPHKPHKISIKPLEAVVVLVFGIAGAYLFSILTGKTDMTDSSIFLTLIVAITVGQTTYNIVKQESFSLVQKVFVPIALFVTGIVLYALLYNGVTIAMADLPMIEQPQPLSIIQIVFGIIFLIGFFIMKLGVYRKVPWLYVKLMNISQPNAQTVLKYKTLQK